MSEQQVAGEQPFAGIRVLDCTHVLAGPYCTYQLALLGADVTRVERVGVGDLVRHHGSDASLNAIGLGTSFLGQNANKRSIAIDLKAGEGQALFKSLAQRADVIVENFRPGVMRRLGLDFASLSEANPTIVYASISGYGQMGEMAHAPAYDHIMQAFSGVMDQNGAGADPARINFPAIDYVTGLAGAFAISAALRQRDRCAKAQYIDVSMLDSALTLMNSAVAQSLINGTASKPNATIAFSGSPFSGVFDTDAGLLSVTANTKEQARALCSVIGQPELADEGLTPAGTMKTSVAQRLRPKLARIFLTHDADYWEDRLTNADVPAARVRTIDEAVSYAEREGRHSVLPLETLTGPTDAATRVPGTAFNLSWGGARAIRSAPRLGQHSAEILEELGISAQAQAELRRAGIVGDDVTD